MSRSVRMPIARSSWSITTTDPTRRSCMRCAATATVSAGCAVTTGRDMTSATVRSPGAGMGVSGMAGFYDRPVRRRRRGGPCSPCANLMAPSSDSPEASVTCACRSSMRMASSSGSPHCSYDERRSSRRQTRRERGQLVRELRAPRRARRPVRSGGWRDPCAALRRRSRRGPVRMRSSACEWPIKRGRRTVPPSTSGTPQRRQNTPNTASRAATRRSHHTASSSPPATA